jgi:hypothetical protein
MRRGRFMPSDTTAAAALQFYAIGLLGIRWCASPRQPSMRSARSGYPYRQLHHRAGQRRCASGWDDGSIAAWRSRRSALLNAGLLLLMLRRQLGGSRRRSHLSALLRIRVTRR